MVDKIWHTCTKKLTYFLEWTELGWVFWRENSNWIIGQSFPFRFFGLGNLNEACDTNFSHRIWPSTSFICALWLNPANWLAIWLFLVATFSCVNPFRWSLWYVPVFYTEFDPLQVFAIKTEYFVTKISVKELSGLDQKLFQLLDIYISFKEPSGLNHKFICSFLQFLKPKYFWSKPLDSLTEIQIYRNEKIGSYL